MNPRPHVATKLTVVVALLVAPLGARGDGPDAVDLDATIAPGPWDVDAAAPDASSDAAAPDATAPPDAADASAAPSPVVATPPSPVHRARRHRRRARRVRRRGTGLLRNRGAIVTLGWRYTNVPTEGRAGPTHGFSLDVMPLARLRGVVRYVRLDVGGEFALRLARGDTTDTITWLHVGVGGQYPTRWITPWAMLSSWVGFATRYRFFTPIVEDALALGLEGGADLRLVGFAGITASAGVGRVVIGDQGSWGAWIRAGAALF